MVEIRPVYHCRKRDNVKGHIFTCFLALYLAALLQRKLKEAGVQAHWDEVIRDLSEVRAVTVALASEPYLVRSPMAGCAGRVFAAVGVKPPPLAQPAWISGPPVGAGQNPGAKALPHRLNMLSRNDLRL